MADISALHFKYAILRGIGITAGTPAMVRGIYASTMAISPTRTDNLVATSISLVSTNLLRTETPLRYNEPVIRTNIASKVIRKGDPIPDDRGWENATAAERIEAVWYLTLLCLNWNGGDTDEPRLQRSIVRIQRPES